MYTENGASGMASTNAMPEALSEEISLGDTKTLRTAFGTFPTGVTILSVGGPSPRGMTANSFTSVSLDPPLVLACIGRDARMHDSLLAAGSFGVSILAADQEKVARHFANKWRPHGLEGFDPVEWRAGWRTGSPLILGALAWFECALWRTYDGGDHSIFVGQLVSAQRHDGTNGRQRRGLVFHGGTFRQLREETL